MLQRMLKFCITTAHIVCLWLTFKLVTGQLDWGFASGAIGVCGFWLAVTGIRLRSLFNTYFDTLSRLQVLVPMNIGLVLSGLVVVCDSHWSLKVVAGLEFLAWGLVYLAYRRNRLAYISMGHGPLPKECWVNPPAEALVPGDLILTSGRIATRIHESVGHGEVVIVGDDSKLWCFSSYMENGTVYNPAEKICSLRLERGHYIVLRLNKPLTDAQLEQARREVKQMMTDNSNWRCNANAWRHGFIGKLPLPASWRAWLVKRFTATGYDWNGLFIGTRAENRWTCVGACLELYKRLGVKTNRYGTGLMGLGTGILDPIMPVRFLADPNFRMLTLDDQKSFELEQAGKSQ